MRDLESRIDTIRFQEVLAPALQAWPVRVRIREVLLTSRSEECRKSGMEVSLNGDSCYPGLARCSISPATRGAGPRRLTGALVRPFV